MEELTLDSIKRESVKRIFGVLSQGGMFSRAEISGATGLSLMTVGKILGVLDKNNALIQYKQNSDSPGRKSSLCGLSSRCASIVFDLSAENYTLHVVDILLNSQARYSFGFDDLKEKAAEAFFEFTSNGGKIIGTGCILPNSHRYDETFRKRFTEAHGSEPDVFESEINAVSIANSARFKSRTSVHIRLPVSGGESAGAFIDTGNVCRRTLSVGKLIELCGDPVNMITAVCLTVAPDIVRIESVGESGFEPFYEKITKTLRNYIQGSLPEIIVEAPDSVFTAVNGMAGILRDNWLLNII